MKITLNVKIFLVVLFSILIALVINSMIHFASVKKDYLINFYSQSEKDMQIVKSNIKEYEEKIEILLKKFSSNELLKATLNLISNYQDINNYETLIFDQEKKKLLRFLEPQINNVEKFSFEVFDKNKNPILINDASNLQSKKGIFTYKNKKIQMISLFDDKIENIPFIDDILDDQLNKTLIIIEDETIGIRSVTAIYDESQLLGYIRIKKVFDQKNIDEFIKNTTNSFSFLADDFILGETKNIDKKLIQGLSSNFNNEIHSFDELLSDEKYYYHTHYKKAIDNKKLYFVVSIKKEYLDKRFKSLISELILTAIIATLISFIITTYFLKVNLLNRIDNLLWGIRKIKNKKYVKIESKGVDEIDEISDELNTLTDRLEESFDEIEKLNEFLRRIIDSVPVRIFWKDTEGRYIGANKLFLEDAKLTHQKDLIGKTDYDNLPWSKDQADKYVKDDYSVILNNKSLLFFEEKQTTPNGDEIILLTSKVPLTDKENNVIGVLGIYEDITEQKRLQKELKDKDLILFESSKMAAMGEMLESIAHQWRQPLSVITTGASGIKINKEYDILTDEMLLDTLTAIEKSAMHLSDTIDDFRDFYKKDKHKYIFNIKDTINKSLGLVTSKIRSRDIELVLDMKNVDFMGYENELIQVFMNILNNSIDQLEDIENQDRLILISLNIVNDTINISFKDNAGGIGPEVISHVFEHKFTTKLKKDGTGIGLYMSKLIIEKSDGNISAKSVELEYQNKIYKGAEFLITFPYDINYN